MTRSELSSPRAADDCIALMIHKPFPREADITRSTTASIGHRTIGLRGIQ